MKYGTLGIVVVCIIIILIYQWYTANIRKLSSDGWVFYYSSKCIHCVKQMKHLGSLKLCWMSMVNCVDNPEICKEKGVTAFPTWLNNKTGQIYVGTIILYGDIADTELFKTLTEAPIPNESKINRVMNNTPETTSEPTTV
jgi:hypothetical protein